MGNSTLDPRDANSSREILMPGAISVNMNEVKGMDVLIKVAYFSIGPDNDDASAMEKLLNREEVLILDWQKFTCDATFFSVIIYSEPKETKKKVDDGIKELKDIV